MLFRSVFSLNCRVQIGIRFMFTLTAVTYTAMAVAVARGWSEPGNGRYAPRWFVAILLAVMAGTSAWVWPHGLSYVNEFWGGTARGYRHIGESNYDWGQGLKELARWRQQHADVPLDLWYFGTDPAWKSLPARPLALHIWPLQAPEDVLKFVRGRYLAVSTTLVYGAWASESHELASMFLRARQPAARTMTFLIYDFTQEPTGGPSAVAVRRGD